MINIVLWLVVGGALGWLASIGMQIYASQGVQIDAQQALLLNMSVGIVGAFVGGVLFSLLRDDGSPLAPSVSAPCSLRSVGQCCWRLSR